MPSLINCPSCSRAVPMNDGRMPPWCRSCGASLNEKSVRAATAKEPQAAAVTPPSLPSFHACVPQVLQHERLTAYRFYVAAEELLVFPAGLASIQEGIFVPQSRAASLKSMHSGAGGLAGAFQQWSESKAMHAADRLAELEGATEAMLVAAAQAGDGALALRPVDLSQVHIDPPGGWFGMLRGFRCTALLNLGHTKFGTLALPSASDCRVAIEGLTKLLGKSLVVNVPWGAGRF
jgi:hypothetical protein